MKKINKIFNTAKRDKWVVEYDSDLDTLYWSKPKISAGATSKKFLDDFSMYINKKGIVEGIFIEYAKHNFVSHNTEYKALFDELVKVGGDKYIIPKENAKNVEDLLQGMANMVANETLDAVLKGVDLKNMVSA